MLTAVFFGALAWNAAYPSQTATWGLSILDRETKRANAFPLLFECIDVQDDNYYVHPALLDFFEGTGFQEASSKQAFSRLFPLAQEWGDQKFSSSDLNVFSLCSIVECQTRMNLEQGTEFHYCFQALSDLLICALKKTDPALLRQLASCKETCLEIRNSSFRILFGRNIPERITEEERKLIAPFMPDEIAERSYACVESARTLSPEKFPDTTHRTAILKDMLDIRAGVEASWRRT